MDPFAGSGTTMVAARDCIRSALGADLKWEFVDLAESRLAEEPAAEGVAQHAVCTDARELAGLVEPGTVALLLTSPPYANCLNRPRRNKSRRTEDRRNEQYGRVEPVSYTHLDVYKRQGPHRHGWGGLSARTAVQGSGGVGLRTDLRRHDPDRCLSLIHISCLAPVEAPTRRG